MDQTAHNVPTSVPFTEAEWKDMQKDDIHAGGAVVSLMAGIFTIGLIIYSIVLWAVLS
jgi:hypothetical protein